MQGSIPSDPAELAALLGITKRKVEAAYPHFQRCFRASKRKGRWTHRRVEAEMRAQKRRRAERSEAGLRGAKKRYETNGMGS